MLKHKTFCIGLTAILLLFLSCKNNEKNIKTTINHDIETKTSTSKKIKIALGTTKDTKAKGSVVFKEGENGVTITAIISGLTTGEHPVYIVDKNTKLNAVFIGNLIADKNGNGTISKTLETSCIDCGEGTKDILGKVLVVYNSIDKSTVSCKGIIE